MPRALVTVLLMTGALAVGLLAFQQPGAPQTAPSSSGGAYGDYRWRSIGPASIGGRISDVEALDSDFRVAYVGAASGGVWKTTNAGTTWTPVFDRYGAASIGDIALSQKDPNIVWVGTGEANNRNSVAWGDGIYKSTNGGETFERMGLRDTYQIARVIIHPANPDIVYAAAVGNLWGHTGQRGVFKTADGGKSWQKLTGGLPDDGKTGATDLVIDSSNPNVLYAAMYERLRRPFRFDSGGPNGGIFKTTDGGKSWRKLAKGLPTGDTGRIGLDVFRRNPRIVMAMVEHGFQPAQNSPDYADMTKLGSGIYRSEDGGESWRYVNRYNNRPFYYSQIRINPSDDQLVYFLTTSFRWSRDGGKTITAAPPPFGGNYDHHAMWIDPSNKDRFWLGKDKGLTLTFDHGSTFVYFENLPIAQYYAIDADMREPYAIYGGLQDNGSFAAASFTRDVLGIRNDSAYKMHWGDGMHALADPRDWRVVYSSAENGSFRLFDPLTRTDTSRRPAPRNIVNFAEATKVDPAAPDAGDVLRFNWQAPMILSPHDPDVVYLGGNYVLRTDDKGLSWRIVSRDLSRARPETINVESGGLTPDNSGAETHATVVSLSESRLVRGLIWAGTDDGNVHVTRDGGTTWTRVDEAIAGVPKDLWVSDVEASSANPDTAYVTFDGHHSDNRDPWLFKTTDGGKTWTNLSGSLTPGHPIYVLVESPRNPNLLFVGTEFGIQFSFNGGRHWQPFGGAMQYGLPTVAVHDLIIHPRDRDLIAATHGRGLYILDDISALEEITPQLATKPVHLFTQRRATIWVDQSRSGQLGENTWAGENPPSVAPVNFAQRDRARLQNTPLITMAMSPAATGTATLEITAPDGRVRSISIPAKAGITRYRWDGRMDAGGGGRGGGRGGRAAAATPPPAGDPPAVAQGGARGRGAGGGEEGGPPPQQGGGRGRGGAAAGLEPGTYALMLTLGTDKATGTLAVRPDPVLR